MVEFRFKLASICTMALLDAPVAGSDLLNPTITPTTDSCGRGFECVPPGTELSIKILANGFVPAILQTMRINQSVVGPTPLLICSAEFQTLTSMWPMFDPAQAALFVNINALGSPVTCDAAGWSLRLTDLDGGAVQAPVAFLNGSTLDPTLTATTPEGYAAFYNIDPSIGTVRVVATHAPLPDGHVCTWAGDAVEIEDAVKIQAAVVSLLFYDEQ